MSRYIDIDNIEVDKYVTVWDCNCSEYGRQTVMAVDDLHYLPTVDAQPVVHGKWIYDKDGNDWGIGAWKCSICGSKNDNLGIQKNFNPLMFGGGQFCPHCGAKMRDG